MTNATPMPSSFLDNLTPALEFVAPQQEVAEIPKGLLACCRVVHQAGCQYHVARSLVGAATRRRYRDTGRSEEWIHPHPVSSEGDVLTEPTALFAAVKAHWMLARATADALGADVYEMTVGVFLLNVQQAAEYDEVMTAFRERVSEVLGPRPSIEPEILEMLPVEPLDDEDDVVREATSLDFVTVGEYAPSVLVYPSEIGSNGVVRFVTSSVWAAPETEAMQWQPDPDPFPSPIPTPSSP